MFYEAEAFCQDISGWNVENIGSKPDGFDKRSALALECQYKPFWGNHGWPKLEDLPQTTILVSNKELTWAELPAVEPGWNESNPWAGEEMQPDTGLTLLSLMELLGPMKPISFGIIT